MTMTPSLRRRMATFRPKRVDDLNADAIEFIGQHMEWRGLWVVEPEDGGPYVGQMVWEPVDRAVWFGWVPDEDLKD